MRNYRRNTATESLVSKLSKMTLEERFEYWSDTHNIYDWKPFVSKNSKVFANIFDLHPIITCPNCDDCKSTCYAVKFEKMYATCLMRRTVNTYLAFNDIPLLEKLIITQLFHTRQNIVRLNASGDFHSQSYVDMWTRIVERFPSISFYTYTKSNFDFTAINALPNFNLVSSICPDGSINYGSLEEIKVKARAFHAPICPYRKGQNNPHCGKECTTCLHHPLVLFVQH